MTGKRAIITGKGVFKRSAGNASGPTRFPAVGRVAEISLSRVEIFRGVHPGAVSHVVIAKGQELAG
jgi:hypothetical protein